MIISYLKNLCKSYSYLALSQSQVFGLVLLLISFVNPSSAFLSLIAFCAALVLGILIGLKKEHMLTGMYTFNSLLVGLSMGFLFEVSMLSVLFTVIASVFTMLLSFALHSIFTWYLHIPILNLPSTITASLVYLASIRYGNLYTSNTIKLSSLNFEHLPIWLSGLFKSTGTLLFLPYDFIGMGILVSMLFFSRINFFLTITGYYAGTSLLTVLKGSSYAAYSDVYSFNFILIALALGGLFLIPSIKTYIIAFTGVFVSVFILDAVDILWSSYGIPVFAFPFVIVVLLVLYVLNVNKFPLVTSVFLDSPEQNLEHYINHTARFNQLLPQPHLPFSGTWTVYQAFDDEWTHKGVWAHAVDFVITDTDGKTFRMEGKVPEDYYCFNKPVLSPVSGRIIEVWNECFDNPIGVTDEQNNWGNYVILYSDWGYYIEISHFARGSIVVRAGDYVTQGQLLGKCGNSGFSPQPHIHIQCQYLPHIGAPTTPFSFTNCISDNRCRFGIGLQIERGVTLRPVVRSRQIERRFQFVLGDQSTFDIFRNEKKTGSVRISVRMAPDGSYYFEDSSEGGRLFFSNREGVFTFYRFEGNFASPIRYLFVALPRMPLTDECVSWNDEINFSLLYRQATLASFLKAFKRDVFRAFGEYCICGSEINGSITSRTLMRIASIQTTVRLGETRGFEKIAISTPDERVVLQCRAY